MRKVYQLGKVSVEAVRGISFAIEQGEFVSIFLPEYKAGAVKTEFVVGDWELGGGINTNIRRV